MQKLLNEWRSFLAEAKKYTEDDVKAAIAKYKGKKVGVVKPFDFGEFLKEMAQAESRYNPYARSKSGTFIGAFQLGPDHHKGKLDVAYNPEHLETAVKQFGEPTLYYLAHNQGKAGAVRILYAAIGKEKKLSAGKLDNATLERMKGQNISMIKPFLDDPLLPNQEKAKAFINYFKGKYKF